MMKHLMTKKFTISTNENKIYGLYSINDENYKTLCSISRDKNVLENIAQNNSSIVKKYEIKPIPVFTIIKINSPTSNIFNYNIQVFGKDKNLIVVKSSCKKNTEKIYCWNKTKVIDGIPISQLVLLEMNEQVYQENFEEIINEKYFETNISKNPLSFDTYEPSMFCV